jgi:glycosyltransferase involved in cell wall biosynthesis
MKTEEIKMPEKSALNPKAKVLFIYENLSEFVARDIDLLRKDFEVIPFHYTKKRFKLILAVMKSDVNISRFALGYAAIAVLFSKLFGKKSIVVVSGYDVVTIPEFEYGAMLNPKRVRETKFSLKRANAVTAESESLKQDTLKHVKREILVIHQGFESKRYSFVGEKESMAITVGNVTKQNFKRKGLEYFVKAAKYLPDVQFVLIGKFADDGIEQLRIMASDNVKFTGFIEEEELIEYYRRAKVYVQVSAHEGFGCSLAEAMLCECVPVVTDRGAIPEVVGDTGFYVPYQDVEATAEAIREGLSSEKGKEARERIVTLFPPEKRRQAFRKLILGLLDK